MKMHVTDCKKKVPKENIKSGEMEIDFLNSKAEKAYHWGVKTAFNNKISFSPFCD